jgi:hypothetical protein
VGIVAGAEQEQVVADIAAAPAPEVLARLLNGSAFNFLILSSSRDPRVLERVILSARGAGAVTPLPQMVQAVTPSAEQADDDDPPANAAQPPGRPEVPPGRPVQAQPEANAASDDNPPN